MAPRYRLPIPIATISLLLACLFATGSAGALARFDFEQPYFLEELDVYCKDHAVVKVDGIYHVFYIQSFPPEPGEYLRSEKWLGHITSDDLRHWTHQDSILPVSEVPGTWEDHYIWAPKLIWDEVGENWFLYYTGVDENIAQQAGLAFGSDLYDWSRWPMNPIYWPGSWASWEEGSWSNCRDPEIFHMEGEPDYYMLNTVTMLDGRGAISLASSSNYANWDDLGPFFVNDTDLMLESPQLLYESGYYHLFFTEEGVQGTSHISNVSFLEGWTKENLTIIDNGNAPEISRLPGEDLFSRHNAIATPDGPLYFLRFDHIDLATPDQVPAVEYLGGLGGEWTVIFGNAFDNQPTWGDNPYQRGDESSNMEGNSYLATYEDFPAPVDAEVGQAQGPLLTGLMRTPSFTLTGNRIRLLVGGGDEPELCFVGLVRESDERLLFMETGTDSFGMDLRLWNCSTLLGETVYLVVADLGMHDWEHISTDSIEEYDEQGQDPITPSDPLDPGPLLADILAAAGFGDTGSDEQVAGAPGTGRLLAPHPNPFNPHTRLRYELARETLVELGIHDASGRRVRILHAGRLGPGPGFFTWDGRDDAGRSLASGVYVARLDLDGVPTSSRKLVLVR